MTQKKLKIRDLTLRDGQQSSFATRMTQAQVDRVLPFYKDANFYAMEVWGGAVPDSVMRYLGENPWHRLEKIKAVVGDVSKLTALSRGRNLFGYNPYTDEIIDGFSRNAIESGLGIMRIFDALNDVNNVKSTIKYVKKYGGIADCAVCYTIDPNFTEEEKAAAVAAGKPLPGAVFTDEYFVNKAKQMAELGADMITIKDMSGLIPPARVAKLITLFKENVNVPIDFHTHSTPGYGLASVLGAIVAGADIVDTAMWNFAGGPAAPAFELVYVICKKLGIELDIDMEAVAKINKELIGIREELAAFDTVKKLPVPFNPLTDALPEEAEKELDKAIAAAQAGEWEEVIRASQAVEAAFGFPAPNVLVQKAEIPGGMYTNMVAQLKALNCEDILEKAMELIPTVRLAAGLPPLVTPTSQIVGAQAVNCAIALNKGDEMYTNVSNQFFALVKGEYGETPVPVDPDFRFKICGIREETNYDTSKYQTQPNPVLENLGGVRLAEDEKEFLLLELFPSVATGFLKGEKKKIYEASNAGKVEETAKAAVASGPVTGEAVEAPLPGSVFKITCKVGDTVSAGDEVIVLEAMKMENSITTDYSGVVKAILVSEGDAVQGGQPLVIVEDPSSAPVAVKPVQVSGEGVEAPLPGSVFKITCKVGDVINAGDEVIILEAMKMENSITSDYAGTVQAILVEEGDAVQGGQVMVIVGDGEVSSSSAATVAFSGPTETVEAPLPGSVFKVCVAVGDKVKEGDEVIVLEAMKMENSITTDYAGVVVAIHVEVGDAVQGGQVMVEIG